MRRAVRYLLVLAILVVAVVSLRLTIFKSGTVPDRHNEKVFGL